ncbi:MAG: aerotolerance regulator BatA [Anaerolinea sp.]|nr:aerotolerance regulator BatA [Anaerolinea sp.]
MEFAAPAALALAGLALPVALLALFRGKRSLTVPSTRPLLAVRPSFRLRLLPFLPALRALAVCALAVAVAGPRIGNANAVVPGQGIDIALSIDISSSMDTSGFGSGTRLEATKRVIRDFIKGRENDRIGIVVFQRDALPLTPPSLDYEALDKTVADLESGLLPDGTGIGVGLAEGLNMLRESTAASRIVILLTDGEHNASSISPEDAAELANALKIRVYTIGVVSDTAARRAEVDEELLQAIADRTGARYFKADNPRALLDIYEEIGRLETSRVGRERFERFTELSPWFAAAAGGLLLLDLAARATWLRRSPA